MFPYELNYEYDCGFHNLENTVLYSIHYSLDKLQIHESVAVCSVLYCQELPLLLRSDATVALKELQRWLLLGHVTVSRDQQSALYGTLLVQFEKEKHCIAGCYPEFLSSA